MGQPVTARLIAAVAICHLVLTPRLFPEAIRGIASDGVVDSITSRPAEADRRGHAFWYVTCGLALLSLSAPIGTLERRVGRPPHYLAWLLTALASWGVIFMPRSGFWLLTVPAAAAFVRSRPDGDGRPAPSETRDT